MAERPVAWHSTRDEAAVRCLRVPGLTSRVTTNDAAVGAELRQEDGADDWPWIRARSPSGGATSRARSG